MNCSDVLSVYNILDMILSITDICIILYFFFLRPRRKKVLPNIFKKFQRNNNKKFFKLPNGKANKTTSV